MSGCDCHDVPVFGHIGCELAERRLQRMADIPPDYSEVTVIGGYPRVTMGARARVADQNAWTRWLLAHRRGRL